mmetsp:Transcript_48496/g.150031  ORF Transcript_48496/g.150031 Transcript_48496/m.150031 type:complete len:344 (-) Transcript_48496:332-1363(-)
MRFFGKGGGEGSSSRHFTMGAALGFATGAVAASGAAATVGTGGVGSSDSSPLGDVALAARSSDAGGACATKLQGSQASLRSRPCTSCNAACCTCGRRCCSTRELLRFRCPLVWRALPAKALLARRRAELRSRGDSTRGKLRARAVPWPGASDLRHSARASPRSSGQFPALRRSDRLRQSPCGLFERDRCGPSCWRTCANFELRSPVVRRRSKRGGRGRPSGWARRSEGARWAIPGPDGDICCPGSMGAAYGSAALRIFMSPAWGMPIGKVMKTPGHCSWGIIGGSGAPAGPDPLRPLPPWARPPESRRSSGRLRSLPPAHRGGGPALASGAPRSWRPRASPGP